MMRVECVGGGMSEREEAGGGLLSGPPTAAALSAVPSNDPVSASEVADELGVAVATAREALRALVAEGALAHRHVQGRASAIDVWYRPRTSESPSLEDRVADAIEDMDVPGASEMMQSWRRDAVREAFEYLQVEERASTAAIIENVYPTHPAGYDEEQAWWAMVAPRLRGLPGVEPPVEDGADWRFTGDV
jgi:DNA-binding transcriptional regulator YhcF (GntR family)